MRRRGRRAAVRRIAYRSRLGDEFENWALFEQGAGHTPLTDLTSAAVDPDDLDLLAALELLGLELI